MGNFSRFIRPGARRVDVQTSAPASVAYQSSTVVSAFLAPEPDQLIVVAINELTTPAPIELVIPTDAAAATLTPHITSAAHDLEPGEARTVLAEGGRIRATVQLHPQSVTTFVITLER
jgi:O-glycosyl hydrolase